MTTMTLDAGLDIFNPTFKHRRATAPARRLEPTAMFARVRDFQVLMGTLTLIFTALALLVILLPVANTTIQAFAHDLMNSPATPHPITLVVEESNPLEAGKASFAANRNDVRRE